MQDSGEANPGTSMDDFNPTPSSSVNAIDCSTMQALSNTITEDRQTIGGDMRNELDRPLINKLQQLSMESGAVTYSSHSPTPPLPKQSCSSTSSTTTPERQVRGLQTPDTSRMSPTSGNSPSSSQVSVGSVPPVLAAALLVPMARHYDLTPITRNTSNSHQRYVDDEIQRGGPAAVLGQHGDDDFNVVSPDMGDGGFLHGEHLTLPTDLSAECDGPILPPLQKDRSRSAGALSGMEPRPCHHQMRPHSNNNNVTKDEFLPPPVPIQFPSRKFYSFTSRKQYEHVLQQQHPTEGQVPFAMGKGLTLYQPSRQEDLDNVGDIPAEELQRIFVARRTGASSSNAPLDSGESHANHRLLQNPIPLEERQWSIPSIRMANHLTGGSTASYTDNTEDEDESPLFIREDDASWSTRGSSLCLHDEHDTHDQPHQDHLVFDVNVGVLQRSQPTALLRQQPQTQIFMEQLDRMLDQPPIPRSNLYDTDSDEEDLSSSSGVGAVVGVATPDSRRKRKLRVKEQQALDWLQSVEADQNVLAEAASSKFLTGNVLKNNSPSMVRQDDLHPTKSSPSRLSATTTLTTTNIPNATANIASLERPINFERPHQQLLQPHALRRQTLPPSIFKAVLPTS